MTTWSGPVWPELPPSLDLPSGPWGSGLRLTPYEPADAAAVLALVRGDPEITRWSMSLRRLAAGQGGVKEAEAWIRSRLAEPGRLEWAVRGPGGGLRGRIGVHGLDDVLGIAEVGYAVYAPFRRRGQAVAALRRVAAFAFGELGLARIELEHAVGNVGSCAVARVCGFALEGTLRAGLIDPAGNREDAHLHARLPGDPVDLDRS